MGKDFFTINTARSSKGLEEQKGQLSRRPVLDGDGDGVSHFDGRIGKWADILETRLIRTTEI